MENQKDLNKGRIEMDMIDTCEGRVDIVMSKSDFIDICNDSGWRINFCGDYALCGDEVCFNYSEITCIASFYPKYITKPSRIREEDVLDIYYDKHSEGDDKGYCAVEVNHKKINFVEFALELGWAAGFYDCDNSKDELMATRENENSPITFFSR